MVKIDVDAVGKLLDELLSEPMRRSPYEDLEPDVELMDSIGGWIEQRERERRGGQY